MTNIEFFKKEYENNYVISKLEHTTSSVQSKLSNIKFKEEELINKLRCECEIVAIDCNYGHFKLRFYEPPSKNKISNRGRKKEIIKNETRKNQGDGSSFGTSIQFTIAIEVIRRKKERLDKYSNTAISISDKYEEIFKEYKVKLFRNGVISIPGIIEENHSDALIALDILTRYLNELLYNKKRIIKIIDLFPTMKNYKCRLLDNKKIDMRKFHNYCEEYLGAVYNVNFMDILEFFKFPIIKNKLSNKVGWNRYLNSKRIDIDWDKFYPYLDRTSSAKNIFIDKKELLDHLKTKNIEAIYEKLLKYLNKLQKYYIIFDDSMIKAILGIQLAPIIHSVQKLFKKSKENSLNSMRYDPENCPGLLIYVNTPTYFKPEKKATIEIFPSGKIGLEGNASSEIANYIYNWLNNVFYENKSFSYAEDYIHDCSDSEFSEDEESF